MNDDTITLPLAADTDAFVAKLQKAFDALNRLSESETKAAQEARKADAAQEALGRRIDALGDHLRDGVDVLGMWVDRVRAVAEGLVDGAARAEQHQRAVVGLRGAYDAVRAATNDTVSAQEAYAVQLTFTNSRMAISGEQLATLTRYAREHKQATESVAEASQRLAEGLREGSQDALTAFGISVQDGASRLETFRAAMDQMRTSLGDTAPAARTLTEDTERMGREFGRATDAGAAMVSRWLGLRPALRGLATDIGQIADSIEAVNDAATQRSRDADNAALARARQDFIARERVIGSSLGALGLDRSLLPGTNINRLSREQIEEATGRLARAEALLRERGVSVGSFGQPASAGRIASLDEIQDAFRRGPQAGPSSRDTAREIAAILRGTSALMANDNAANDRAQRGARPVDSGGSGGGSAANDAARQWSEFLDYLGGAASRAEGIDLRATLASAREAAQTVDEDLRGTVGKRDAQRATQEAAFRGTDAVQFRQRDEERRLERERRHLDERYELQRTFTDRMEELFDRQVNGAQELSDFTAGAFETMGRAIGTHIQAVIAGREDLGQALQGTLADTLKAIGEEAAIKAGLHAANALASAIFAPPVAVQEAAAAAAYTGVAIAAGVAGAALTPSAPQASSGADRGASDGRARSPRSDSRGDAGDGPRVYQYNIQAPLVNGTTATVAQAGAQLDAFLRAGRARQRRAA